MPRIPNLNPDISPTDDDLVPVADSVTGIVHKVKRSHYLNANPITDPNIQGVTDGDVLSGLFSGWVSGQPVPTAVTYLGNRSYQLSYASSIRTYKSPGARSRITRTTASPTQCASLNGTTQYYSKATPSGMAWTDDFASGAWVKLGSYNGAQQDIFYKYNGTSGWILYLTSSGQIEMTGYNAGAANFSRVTSYQTVPLNKWVHIAAQLDMSAFTASTTQSYVMFDGQDVPAVVTRGGTNPTALIQAGDLGIGAASIGTQPFNGKIAQVWVSSAKVTQTNVRTIYSQGINSSDITTLSIASAYSLNNSITDLNTTSANNLTANGSATATNADSPFSQDAYGTPSGTKDYCLTMAISTDGLTETVQVPEGCTITTSGSITSIDYSGIGVPFGFPAQKGKWWLTTIFKVGGSQASPGNGTWYNIGSVSLNVPTGDWNGWYYSLVPATTNAAGATDIFSTLSTTNSSESDPLMTTELFSNTNNVSMTVPLSKRREYSLSVPTIHYLNEKISGTNYSALGLQAVSTITFEPANL